MIRYTCPEAGAVSRVSPERKIKEVTVLLPNTEVAARMLGFAIVYS